MYNLYLRAQRFILSTINVILFSYEEEKCVLHEKEKHLIEYIYSTQI